jgi:pimeloyl-ACP methyl ester carboxylesterase
MQPIVIFGGFLSIPMLYQDMRSALTSLTGQPTWIVHTHGYDWLMSMTMTGWGRLLDKLDRVVRQAVEESSGQKAILIGHSAGGVLARQYLNPKPFLGKAYRGIENVDHLITLGSPHYNKGGLTRGGRMSRWVEKHNPGAAHSPQVKYTSVAGKFLYGSQFTTRQARWAYDIYADICGNGNSWGDGIVPVESAILEGSRTLVLENVSHFSILGEPWYGSQEVIPFWWRVE